jgi:hypothetical protein
MFYSIAMMTMERPLTHEGQPALEASQSKQFSIDAAFANLVAVLPPRWRLRSISVNAAFGYDVIVMTEDRVSPQHPWRVDGIGPTIADALNDATAKVRGVATALVDHSA